MVEEGAQEPFAQQGAESGEQLFSSQSHGPVGTGGGVGVGWWSMAEYLLLMKVRSIETLPKSMLSGFEEAVVDALEDVWDVRVDGLVVDGELLCAVGRPDRVVPIELVCILGACIGSTPPVVALVEALDEAPVRLPLGPPLGPPLGSPMAL